MSLLSDQAERDRFVTEHGKNISVIAPAGVGKTRAIVDRIVHLAKLPGTLAVDRLSRLVVVTYSVRAAQEMQQRARAALRREGINAQVHRAFQQTFFGTIHSYCVRLLDRFGHHLGLPSSVALLQSDDELWDRFLLRGFGQGSLLDPHLRELFHFYTPEKLYALGKTVSPGPPFPIGPMPGFDLLKVLTYRDNTLHPSTQKSIARAQEALRLWSEAWARGDRFRPMPSPPESDKAAAFAQIWMEAFTPVQGWLRDAALAFGRHLANAYAAFRLAEGYMTYDDQVRLALSVLDHPAVQRELAEDRVSLLLDEAQDTDPRQFEVLLRVASLGAGQRQADDQSFCIVGDFQQAIYAPRSDLAAYERVHLDISAEPRGARSRLDVTFRCDRAIIDFVNRLFPCLLDGLEGQSAFVPLQPRSDAGQGQVVRWAGPDQPVNPSGKKIKVDACAQHEARFLAEKIARLGPASLGVSRWQDIAILCPRKDWLLEIQRELVACDLPVQLHSSDEPQGNHTARAWLTSLIWIAAYPEDTFEIAGVLREIFGVSDHDMALHTAGDGEKLRLDRPVADGANPTAKALKTLQAACAQAHRIPLHLAVNQLIEAIRLRERLLSIAEEQSPDEIDREFNDLLALISARCADEITLPELADELRLSLGESSPAGEDIHDAIQLLTSHKAKGLEWPVVILPFIFRSIGFKTQPYPRLVQNEQRQEMICRNELDFEIAKPHVTRRERQQLQRLLYVMCTRAKQTLLLLDDETLFHGTQRRGSWSSGELLGFLSDPNRSTWKSLPETLSPTPTVPLVALPQAILPQPSPILTKIDFEEAISHAKNIPRRITPHTLATHPPSEAEPEKQLEQEDHHLAVSSGHPGIRYGTWWHEFIRTIPWSQPCASWEKQFREALPRSPQPERSTREWELLLNSKLARWLAEPGRLIQVEIPFLWHDSAGSCLEGVMDLAVFSADESSCRVIDWKTNRLDSQGGGGLVEIYRGQIDAYVRALRHLLNAEVKGSLYLTQSGEWLDVL